MTQPTGRFASIVIGRPRRTFLGGRHRLADLRRGAPGALGLASSAGMIARPRLDRRFEGDRHEPDAVRPPAVVGRSRRSAIRLVQGRPLGGAGRDLGVPRRGRDRWRREYGGLEVCRMHRSKGRGRPARCVNLGLVRRYRSVPGPPSCSLRRYDTPGTCVGWRYGPPDTWRRARRPR